MAINLLCKCLFASIALAPSTLALPRPIPDGIDASYYSIVRPRSDYLAFTNGPPPDGRNCSNNYPGANVTAPLVSAATNAEFFFRNRYPSGVVGFDADAAGLVARNDNGSDPTIGCAQGYPTAGSDNDPTTRIKFCAAFPKYLKAPPAGDTGESPKWLFYNTIEVSNTAVADSIRDLYTNCPNDPEYSPPIAGGVKTLPGTGKAVRASNVLGTDGQVLDGDQSKEGIVVWSSLGRDGSVQA